MPGIFVTVQTDTSAWRLKTTQVRHYFLNLMSNVHVHVAAAANSTAACERGCIKAAEN